MSTQDEVLFLAVRDRGDEGAFAALLERHWSGAFRLALALVRDPAGAEDAAQRAFVRLLETARRRGRLESVAGWLRSAVVTEARNLRRAERRRVLREEVAMSRRREAGPEDPAAPVREYAEALPDELREPLVLHYGLGLTHAEVSRALGCPEGTVASRIRSGVEKLRVAVGATAGAVALEATLARALAPGEPVPPVPRVAKLRGKGVAPASGVALASAAVLAVASAVAVVLPETPSRSSVEKPLAGNASAMAGSPPVASSIGSARTPLSGDETSRDSARARPLESDRPRSATTTTVATARPAALVRVKDARGRPVAGATVVLALEDASARAELEARMRRIELDPESEETIEGHAPRVVAKLEGVSDAGGIVRFEDAALGNGRRVNELEVTKALALGKGDYGALAASEHEVTIREPWEPLAERGAAVLTLTAGGAPVAHAGVELLRLRTGGWDRDWHRTDAAGRIAVRDLLPGSYRFVVKTARFAPAGVAAGVASGECVQRDLALGPETVLVGRAVAPPGVRVEEAWLVAKGPDGVEATGRPAADGGFRLEGLGPGTWHLGLSLAGFGPATAEVSIAQPGVLAAPDLRLGDGAAVTGRVRKASGEPGVGVRVVAERAEREVARSATDASGAFAFRGLEPGTYRVRTQTRVSWADAEVRLDVPARGEVDAGTLEIPVKATVDGIVTDANGGPVPGAHVVRVVRGSTHTSVAGPDGRFRFEGLTGDLVLAARAGSRFSVTRRFALSGPLSGVPLVLSERGGSIEGRVTLPPGTSLEGQRVTVYPADRESPWHDGASLEGGSFRFDGLAPGRWSLVFWDLAPTRDVEVRPGEVARADLSLASGTKTLLVVLDGASYGGRVTARWPARGGDSAGESSAHFAAGRASIPRVAPGRVSLDIELTLPTCWHRHFREATVEDGSSHRLEWPANPGAIEGPIPAGLVIRVFGEGMRAFARGEGTFRIEGLAPGTYRVVATTSATPASAVDPTAGATVVVKPGETTRLESVAR